MAKKIGLEVEVKTGQAEQSVGNIRKELKSANAELIAAQKNFGTYSAEAVKAAKKVADLKDSIQDAKETADLFDPGQKFGAFSNALSTVAGGFAAAQGAMGLFGAETQDVEKALLKVQSALALSQGLSQIADAGQAFGKLGTVIKGPVIAAFTTLRGAIMATGIGALVVGIGAIIANFDKLKSSGGLVGKIFTGIGDAVGFVTDKLSDLAEWLGLTASEEERAAERIKKSREQQKAAKEAAYEAELAIARATGKGVAEIEERKRKEVLKTLETQSLQLRLLKSVFGDNAPSWIGDALANIELELTKVRTEQKVAQIEAEKKKQADAKALADKRKTELDAQRKLQQDLELERLSDFDKQLRQLEIQRDERVKIAQGNANLLLEIERNFQAQVNNIRSQSRAESALETEQVKKNEGAKVVAVNSTLQAVVESARNQKLVNKTLAQERQENAALFNDITNNAIEAVGRQTAAGKALGIAQATINAYIGASEVIRAKTTIPEPFGTIAKIANVAAIIATGIRQVKAIASVKVPGGRGASGAGAVPSAAAPITPSAPIAPRPDTTALDQQSINAVGNAAAGRAFVLSTDIQNDRERIAMLNRRARIN